MMDTQPDLSQLVKTLLQEHADYRNSANSPYRSQTLFDDRHQRHSLIDCGWSGARYPHTTPLHLEILENRIWIHRDDTDPGISAELCDRGVPKPQIVLGFRPPALRQHTDFGTPEMASHAAQPISR